MGVTEIVTAAVQPENKLIDAVTGAIGKAYEPKHIIANDKSTKRFVVCNNQFGIYGLSG